MFYTLPDFSALKQLKKRVMGIDYGDHHIGVSLSDLTWLIANPLITVNNKGHQKAIAELVTIIEKYDVSGCVMGYPLNMNGSVGPQAEKVQRFAALLAPYIPILLWDERLSTAAVTRTLVTADISRRKQNSVVDKMAASYILQGALEALR